MDVSLNGKVLLVTGSTQGLGTGIAELALASGAEGVVLTGRDRAKGEALAARLTGKTYFIAADLADPAAAGEIMAASIAHFGRVDLLVNAAGLTDRASLVDGDLRVWDRLFAVNARAPFFLMQALIKDLRVRRAPGAIVNILSMNAHCGAPDLAIYSATKGALSTLTRNVANAHLADRIRCNGINMGWAATPGENEMQARTLGKGTDWASLAAQSQPLGRLLDESEVAQLALFLLSDQAGLLTGALIDLEQTVLGAPARSAAPFKSQNT
jgi:NAD(P)-dependent dehydrogenase (short-subunit alcohol dehydrogenase family)